ncbi:MAG: hypothetical protein Kow0089_22530 [Desulfobulbaceae bacterium]
MKLSIRWTIIAFCIALVWGTHLIITPSSYLSTKQVLTRHMHDIMINISDLALEQAHNHLNKAQSAASLAKQLLSSNVVKSDIGGSAALERYFFDQLSLYPHLSGIYVGGINGNFFMVSRHAKYQPDGYRTKIIRNEPDGYRSVDLTWRDTSFQQVASEQDPGDAYDPRTRPWFKKVMEHRHVVWTDPYIFFTAQKPGVTIAGPTYDEKGDIKGIVGVDIEISELSTFISKLRVGKNGEAFILHRNGDVIAYPDMEKLLVEKENGSSYRLPHVDELGSTLVEKAFQSVNWLRDTNNQITLKEPAFVSFELAGGSYHAMFTPFPDPELPWIIGVYIPEDDYLAEIKDNQLVNILIALGITIIASVLGLFFARRIITPVVQLAQGARDIEEHGVQAPFHLETGFRELQETADSFTRMRKALIRYESKLHDSERIHRAITSNANDAILMLNSDHAITFFNPAAEKLFGYTQTEVLEKKLPELLAPKENEHLYRMGITLFLEDSTGAFTNRTVKVIGVDSKGREIPVELSLSRITLDQETHAVAIIRNITERARAAQLRKRLVNDLHDGIGGSLTNIKLLSEISVGAELPERVKKNLLAIADISQDCINEIRNYMSILDDAELNWQSFLAELHQYCAKVLEPHGITFTMDMDVDDEAPQPTTFLSMNVFKIVKEAMNNVIKHSNCDTVTMRVRNARKSTSWIIHDNGKTSSPMESGRGLLSMSSRAQELGGAIEFSWDEGVTITLHIPFTSITAREPTLRDRALDEGSKI